MDEEKTCFSISLNLQPQTADGLTDAMMILSKTAGELTLQGFTPTINAGHFVVED